MTTQHTPGPWVLKTADNTGRKFIDASGYSVCSFDDFWTVTDADAALIQASPDLLAALDALLTFGPGDRTRADARAAIAKATGEPS